MAKLTIKGSGETAETPTTAVVKSAAKSMTVVDALGRSITVRKLPPHLKMKFAEVIGPSASKNEAHVNTAVLAVCVTAIDGEQIPFPTSKMQVEALIARLDDEGVEAVNTASIELMGFTLDDNGNLMKDGKVLTAAKN